MHSLLYKSVYAQQNRAFSSRRKVMSVPVAGWRGEVEIFKNGWTDERKWMNGWTKTDERMNGWTTEALFWMNGWTDERLRRMNGWTDERKWMNGWTDERLSGWTDERMNGGKLDALNANPGCRCSVFLTLNIKFFRNLHWDFGERQNFWTNVKFFGSKIEIASKS